eukprot:scaffold14608_cov168-Amphora_coffeaeformis.AAC.3
MSGVQRSACCELRFRGSRRRRIFENVGTSILSLSLQRQVILHDQTAVAWFAHSAVRILIVARTCRTELCTVQSRAFSGVHPMELTVILVASIGFCA